MKRTVQVVGAVVMVVVLASGCLSSTSPLLRYAVRDAAFQPQSQPWWCSSVSHGDLSEADCLTVSVQLDAALAVAHQHPQASDAIADGATATPYVAGVGAAFELSGPTDAFNPTAPDTILYDGTGTDAHVVALEWNVTSAAAPDGFAGANDVWIDNGDGTWTLRAWIVRPFENQPHVFASTHPCLGATAAVYDLTAACYLATHTRPLEILVTNDDGYAADGIDAVVEGLRSLAGVNVTVVAPATNQSGTGDRTTPGGVTAFAAQTLSGYPAVAVNGFPADSVVHALQVLGENPDLVVSGINFGQNIGPFVPVSGTVGAARTAARNGIPALASSSGFGAPADYPSAVNAVLDWVEDFRLGRAGPPYEVVANLNVPTCTAGSIRGLVEVPVGLALNGRPINPSNCLSTVTTFADDVDAFVNGYITLSDVGLR